MVLSPMKMGIHSKKASRNTAQLYFALVLVVGVSTLCTASYWLSMTPSLNFSPITKPTIVVQQQNVGDMVQKPMDPNDLARLKAFQERLSSLRSIATPNSIDTEQHLIQYISQIAPSDPASDAHAPEKDRLTTTGIREINDIVQGASKGLLLDSGDDVELNHVDEVARGFASLSQNLSALDSAANITQLTEEQSVLKVPSKLRVNMEKARAAGIGNHLLVYRVVRTPGVAVRAQPAQLGPRSQDGADGKKTKPRIPPMIDFVKTHSLVVGVKVVNRFGLWLKLAPKQYVPISMMGNNGNWVDTMKKVMTLSIPKAFNRHLSLPELNCEDSHVLNKKFPISAHSSAKAIRRQLQHCLDANGIRSGVLAVVQSYQLNQQDGASSSP